ncbi:MAG: urease accessory protein UreF [Oxalobacteraceae bacterium]|nr:urease accessory protein UreF [Oxalobacteraceae bacterium]
MTSAVKAAGLLHLLQLCSPSLPVGAYSYSQGLESAMENGYVRDEASSRAWIAEMLTEVIARFDAPLTWRLLQAFVQMGYSLGKLLPELVPNDERLLSLLPPLTELPFPTALAAAAVALKVPAEDALLGMLFSWAENQVLVCVKSVPLGQVAGQRMLLSLSALLQKSASIAMTISDDNMSNWSPGLSILSMQHEVQYSRLYRS